MLGLPISGWIMVSASPLNLSTILFEVIPLPHLPILASLANKAQISDLFHEVHAISSGIMIALLVLHIGAALMHQFVHRDFVMERMAPHWKSKETKEGLGLIAGCIGAFLLGLFLINEIRMHQDAAPAVTTTSGQNQAQSKSISSQVNFKLVLMGEDIKGTFAESSVILNLDSDNPADSSLSATVKTASANTSNPQINDSLPGPDWFDVAQHPEANFVSTGMEMTSETSWSVTGDLTIRETTKPVKFTLNLDPTNKKGAGAFTINRLDYAVGAVEQADDSIAGLNVVIEFDFPIE
jgi:polyisoprenoid-binding protein YceI